MRRLVLIVTWIAVLGAGAAVWISGAGATVAHKPAPVMLRRLAPLRQAPSIQALPGTPCYVGAGGCSEHPCVQFATSSSAVYQLVTPSVVTASPAPSARSRCRSTGSGVARVSLGVVTARAVR